MTHWLRFAFGLLLSMACVAGVACLPRRPATVASRMIEPQVLEPRLAAQPPPVQDAQAPNATRVRLLDTQARGHIGRRVLHQQPSGELTEDAVWRWSSAPDRYLDTAIRIELASRPDLRLVDAGRAITIAATLLEWDLDSSPQMRLVGAVEFQITGTDRIIRTQVVRASEPVSADLPGDLAIASGRLLRRLASEGLQRATDTLGAPQTSVPPKYSRMSEIPLKVSDLETIGYAMAAFLATGFCKTALAMEDKNKGIWR